MTHDLDRFIQTDLQTMNTADLLLMIEELKTEIYARRDALEEMGVDPDEISYSKSLETIQWLRKLKASAIDQLLKNGGSYIFSNRERAEQLFQNYVMNIRRITFEIGTFYGERVVYVAEVGAQSARIRQVGTRQFDIFMEHKDGRPRTMSRNEFLSRVGDLHLGGWDASYHKELHEAVTGKSLYWWMLVEFRNRKKTREFTGTNAHPYNFRSLRELFTL